MGRFHLLPALNLDLRQQGLERGQIGVVECSSEGDRGFDARSYTFLANFCLDTLCT